MHWQTTAAITLVSIFPILSGCSDNIQPGGASENFALVLTVRGNPYFSYNYADTIVYSVGQNSVRLTTVPLPWTYTALVRSGDSISLSFFDAHRDTWADSGGNGYATFGKIEIFRNSVFSGRILGSCSAIFRNVPGMWLRTWMVVDGESIDRNLNLPPEFRPSCDIPE